MSIYTEILTNDYDSPITIASSHKTEKIRRDPTKHYPNKDEARELRKIMASTGLTEEQIRANPTYRKALSTAQKSGQKAKRNAVQKYYRGMIKKACKITKQAPQHPETLKLLDELLKDNYNHRIFRRLYITSKYNAATVVKYYAK